MERAAEAQRAWSLQPFQPTHHPIYLYCQPRGTGAQATFARLSQSTGRSLLSDRQVANTRLRGVPADFAVVQSKPGDIDKSDPWISTMVHTLTGVPPDRLEEPVRHDPADVRRIQSGEVLALAIRAGTNVTIDSATHVRQVFCPTDRLLVLHLSPTAGRRVAAAAWDDTITVTTALVRTHTSTRRRTSD